VNPTPPEPTRTTPSAWRKYTHPEAFCLMAYQDQVTGERELIWNSRDGVTPFTITSRAGNEARHVEWSRDRYVPDYEPPPGSRVFVDLTLERAREYRRAFVERWWDQGVHGARMSERYASKDEAVEQLAQSDMEQGGGGTPDLIEVTARFLIELVDRRAATRAEGVAAVRAEAEALLRAKAEALKAEVRRISNVRNSHQGEVNVHLDRVEAARAAVDKLPGQSFFSFTGRRVGKWYQTESGWCVEVPELELRIERPTEDSALGALFLELHRASRLAVIAPLDVFPPLSAPDTARAMGLGSVTLDLAKVKR
jgi:hypothetical protein